MKLADIDKNLKLQGIEERDIEWHEISGEPFTLHGVYYSKKDEEYLRFSKEFAASFNEYVAYHANRTSGGRVRFRTDSPYVAVRVAATYLDMSSMGVNSAMGVSLYTDNYYSKSFFPDTNFFCGLERGEEVVFEGSYKICKPHDEKLSHDFTLYLPTVNGVKKVWIGVKKGSELSSASAYSYSLPVVFYGSSITMGIGSSRAGNDYVSSVCRMLDCDFINLGLAGQAKGQKEMAEYVAGLKASVYVIDYDYNAPSAAHLEETHYPFYSVVRKRNPHAPILFMSQPNTDYCVDTQARREVIENSYKRAKAEGDKNVYFIDGDTLFAGALRENCTVDRCHPSDLGHYRMAKTVYPVLRELLNIKREV